MNVISQRIPRLAIIAVAVALRALPAQQELPPDRARLADAVRADLSKLSNLERSYFAAHRRFTVDLNALAFVPASGARVSVSYASARTFSASASDVRLAPYVCFVIVSSPAGDSPADKPFCADSRIGSAASALAREAAAPPDTSADTTRGAAPAAPAAVALPAAPLPAAPLPAVPAAGRDSGDAGAHAAPVPAAGAPLVLSATQFTERLRELAARPRDSVLIVVQFAVQRARYDASRGVLEVALGRVALPMAAPTLAAGAARPAFACFTSPAFVCGGAGLTYIARDLWHVPPARAPDAESLRSGLTVQARFAVGRRDDSREPALTLLALILQSRGATLSRWDAAGPG